MITLVLSKKLGITHLPEVEKQYLEALGLQVELHPYNHLCDYVSVIKINSPLSYQLEAMIHQAYCESGNKHYFRAQDVLTAIKRSMNKQLVKKSMDISGHEVTGRNHIVTNPGGKCFSRPMSKWSNKIYESGITYQMLVDDIIQQVNNYYSNKDIVINC